MQLERLVQRAKLAGVERRNIATVCSGEGSGGKRTAMDGVTPATTTGSPLAGDRWGLRTTFRCYGDCFARKQNKVRKQRTLFLTCERDFPIFQCRSRAEEVVIFRPFSEMRMPWRTFVSSDLTRTPEDPRGDGGGGRSRSSPDERAASR